MNQQNSCALNLKGFKDTPIGRLPADWGIARLDEIAVPLTETAGQKKYETVSISAGIGFVNQAEKFGKELSGKQYEKYIVLHKGDFSYNKGNSNQYPQGCIYRLNDREVAAVPNVFESFRIVKGYPEYYEQLFISGFLNHQLYKKINHGVRDDGLLNLTSRDFYSCIIPVPPLQEQSRIIEIFAICDRVIAKHIEKGHYFQALKKACFDLLIPTQGYKVPKVRLPGFDGPWKQQKIGAITDSYSGGTPTAGNRDYYGGKIPFIRSGEIGSNYTSLFLSEKGMNNSSAAMVNEGDILYALYGANSGEVRRSRINGAINQAILAIIPHQEYDSEYLMQWLRMKKDSIVNTYLQGGQGNLSAAIIKEIIIDLPEKSEQARIGAILAIIDNLIDLQKSEIDFLKKEKKAILQQLLTGTVRVST